MTNKETSVCRWVLVDADENTYETGCNNLFTLMGGTPLDNEMRFCCYCGDYLKIVSVSNYDE